MVRLLITSPTGYAQRLLNAFEAVDDQHTFQLVSRPMIHTDVAIDSADFEEFIHQLDQYDYIAFSSRKSIEAFSLGLQKVGVSLPQSVQLCAIGKDNDMLHDVLHQGPAFISAEPSPMGIVRHLSTLSPQGKRIAVLAPRVIGMNEPPIVPEFISALQQIGMNAHRVNAYQTSAASEEMLVQTSSQILQNEYDSVVFTSGTEIKVFLKMVPPQQSLNDFLSHLKVICYGPYTARCAANYGVKVDFTSPAFGSFDELAYHIKAYYAEKK